MTLKLPDGLAARLRATGRRRGVSTSFLLREALEQGLDSDQEGEAGSCLDRALDLAGVVEGPADLSSNRKYLKGYSR